MLVVYPCPQQIITNTIVLGYAQCWQYILHCTFGCILDKAKWGGHYVDIRCCQPIRCPLITDGERSKWWHRICEPSFLFPTEGRRGCYCVVEYAGWRCPRLPLPHQCFPIRRQYPQQSQYQFPPHLRLEGLLYLIRVTPNLQISPAGPLRESWRWTHKCHPPQSYDVNTQFVPWAIRIVWRG